MSEIDINGVLQQMRVLRAQAQMPPTAPLQAPVTTSEKPNFGGLLKSAIDQVNESSLNAGTMQTAFQREDTDASLAEVMIAVEKASLSFEAMTQVRNRLVSAYEEIMRMQV